MSRLTVIAGPTAVGKGTVIKYILEHYPEVQLSISATTRAPRPGEVDGVSYHFLSMEDFNSKIANGQMLEYAVVHGANKYGTLREPVEAAISAGKQMILEIDVQGARLVKKTMPEANLIFIAPPSWDDLVHRLKSRGTESVEEQELRLKTARLELAAQSEFDHVVINDSVAECAQRIVELLQA